MTALPIGTPVKIGQDIPATITAILVRFGNHLTYEVTWWDGRTRKSDWLTPNELTTDGPASPIGFLANVHDKDHPDGH